jgi:hypothetical protein
MIIGFGNKNANRFYFDFRVWTEPLKDLFIDIFRLGNKKRGLEAWIKVLGFGLYALGLNNVENYFYQRL